MVAGKCYLIDVVLLLASLAQTLSTSSNTVSGGEIVLGQFYSCSHGLKGTVIVKNDREVDIRGFSYDGKAPAAWFHAMLKGAPGINSENPFHTLLPFPQSNCERLEVGKEYKNANISLLLPDSILKYETIGVFCHQCCSNFGHIRLPVNLKPEPFTGIITPTCEPPNYPKCAAGSVRNGNLNPRCSV